MAAVLIACNKENEKPKTERLSNFSTVSDEIGYRVKVGGMNDAFEITNSLLTDDVISAIKDSLVNESLFENIIDVQLVVYEGMPYLDIYANNMGVNFLIYTSLVLDEDGNIFLPNPDKGDEVRSRTVECTGTCSSGCSPSREGCTPCDDRSPCTKKETQTFETTWETIQKWLEKIIGIFS